MLFLSLLRHYVEGRSRVQAVTQESSSWSLPSWPMLGVSSKSKSHHGGEEKHKSVTANCQNIPADNAGGTFQFEDKECGNLVASVAGCMVRRCRLNTSA